MHTSNFLFSDWANWSIYVHIVISIYQCHDFSDWANWFMSVHIVMFISLFSWLSQLIHACSHSYVHIIIFLIEPIYVHIVIFISSLSQLCPYCYIHMLISSFFFIATDSCLHAPVCHTIDNTLAYLYFQHLASSNFIIILKCELIWSLLLFSLF